MKKHILIQTSSLLLLFLLFTQGAHAQINQWDIAVARHWWRQGVEPTDFHSKTDLYGGMLRARVSLVDMIINGHEHKFRAGELLGSSFGTGFAKEKINPNGPIGGPDTRKLGTMWLEMDFQAGLQAGFAPQEDLYFGLRAYKEWDFPFVVGSDYPVQSRFYNFVGGSARWHRLYADIDIGWNWDFNRAEEVKDQSVRTGFKYLLGDNGKCIGLRLDLARKVYEDNSARHFNAIEFSFGRVF
jgi:hypothetical protein